MAVDTYYKHSEVTDKIIRAFYTAYNNLGYGFLEKVYENAMIIELQKLGLKVVQQHAIIVWYGGRQIGTYFAYLLINDCVILELKAVESLCEEHEVQLINYLRATNIEVGLLLNFGKEARFKKKLFSNEFKKNSIRPNAN